MDPEAAADASGSTAAPEADGQPQQNGHAADDAQKPAGPADAAAYWAKLEGMQTGNGSADQVGSIGHI